MENPIAIEAELPMTKESKKLLRRPNLSENQLLTRPATK